MSQILSCFLYFLFLPKTTGNRLIWDAIAHPSSFDPGQVINLIFFSRLWLLKKYAILFFMHVIFLDRKVGTYLKINTNSKWIVYNWGIELTHFCICLELKQSIIPNEKCECLTDAAQERNVLESFGPAAEIHLGLKSKILFGN